MKAVVWHGIGDIRLDEVPEPRVEQPTDAVVRLTASAICGTDLHFVRGTFSGMKPGTILGHEGVGVVEALGSEVRKVILHGFRGVVTLCFVPAVLLRPGFGSPALSAGVGGCTSLPRRRTGRAWPRRGWRMLCGGPAQS